MKTESYKGSEDTFKRIWNKIKELCLIKEICADELEGIGLGIPGPVYNQSIVKIAANFSWGNDFNAKKLMEEITKHKVKVENDVRLIALGEQRFGAAKGYENAIVIPIGTGIAAGIISGGKLVSGGFGAAGEFGHIVVNKEGYNCGCKLKGCLETYCSSKGIIQEAKKLLEENKTGKMYEAFKDNINSLDASDVFKYYKQEDKLAIQTVEKFSKYLAEGLGVLINILNPEIIILAGGVAKSSDIIIPLVRKYLPQYALGISIDIPITVSELLDSAGVKGAAALII